MKAMQWNIVDECLGICTMHNYNAQNFLINLLYET